jgi:CheY-like chemotaxis protein
MVPRQWFGPKKEAQTLQQPVSGATPSAATFLVVDDDKGIRLLVEYLLRGEGCTVFLAGNGAEALDVYRQHQSAIDVVLLDLEMPVCDGVQTLALLKQINPQVRCCFMTAGSTLWRVQDLLALGALQVFPKPFPSVSGLIKALRQHAGKPHPIFGTDH